MKRFIISVVCALGLITALFVSTLLNGDEPQKTTTQTPAVKLSEEKKQSGFVVREYQGKIAVFDKNEQLVTVYDVLVSTLPEYDQIQLKQGVSAESEERLRSLIEDYTS